MKVRFTEYDPFKQCLPAEAYIRLLRPRPKTPLTRQLINHILHTIREIVT